MYIYNERTCLKFRYKLLPICKEGLQRLQFLLLLLLFGIFIFMIFMIHVSYTGSQIQLSEQLAYIECSDNINVDMFVSFQNKYIFEIQDF